jgi:hypothetical protein
VRVPALIFSQEQETITNLYFYLYNKKIVLFNDVINQKICFKNILYLQNSTKTPH